LHNGKKKEKYPPILISVTDKSRDTKNRQVRQADQVSPEKILAFNAEVVNPVELILQPGASTQSDKSLQNFILVVFLEI